MRCLVVIDYQNDFVHPDGSLYVQQAEQLSPIINGLLGKYEKVIFSLDWHPLDHISFADNCGLQPFTKCEESNEMKWPNHCVQYTTGSALFGGKPPYPGIDLSRCNAFRVVKKGMVRDKEEYSVWSRVRDQKDPFFDDIDAFDFCGVASDFCVVSSVEDSLKDGNPCRVIMDGVKGVFENEAAFDHLERNPAYSFARVTSSDI